jgi:hypothetical protein
MSKGRKRRTQYFSVKPEEYSGTNFIILHAGSVSTSSPIKCKAKRDILCGICGEGNATAASFLRMFLTAPISVIPAGSILTQILQAL